MIDKEKKRAEQTLLPTDKALDQDTLGQVSAGGSPFEDIKRIKTHEIDEDVYNKA